MIKGPEAAVSRVALRHNLDRVRLAAPSSRIWAVIKADAYGHGMAEVARSLDADGFAVARLPEAQKLRAAGIDKPLLILGGVFDAHALELAAQLGCELAVHDEPQARLVFDASPSSPISVWVKVNTGMNRLGLEPEAAGDWLARLNANPSVKPPVGLMTHLANADDLSDPFSKLQCARLRSQAGDEIPLNIGNSAGILGLEAARTDWIRPGIMLYGVSPFIGETGADRDLQPVMTLSAPVIAVNTCRKGERIGYGGTYQCPEDMPVAVIAIGYGDGYPRHAPTGTPVLLGGRRLPLVGRVSMDMIMVDLRDAPAIAVGDRALLWGQGLPAEVIADAAGTIAYELFTSVTARVPRIYVE